MAVEQVERQIIFFLWCILPYQGALDIHSLDDFIAELGVLLAVLFATIISVFEPAIDVRGENAHARTSQPDHKIEPLGANQKGVSTVSDSVPVVALSLRMQRDAWIWFGLSCF